MLGREGNIIDVDETSITMYVPFIPKLPPVNGWLTNPGSGSSNQPKIGYKAIQEITEDDTLISYDINAAQNDKIKTSEIYSVTEKNSLQEIEYITIEYEIFNSDQPSQIIKVLPYQPIFIRGEYKPANQIQPDEIMYTINEEKAIVKTVTTDTAIVQAYDIRLSGYHNYYLNKILIGDSTTLDISNINEDKQIIENKIGVLIDQKVAIEIINEESQFSSNSLQLSF